MAMKKITILIIILCVFSLAGNIYNYLRINQIIQLQSQLIAGKLPLVQLEDKSFQPVLPLLLSNVNEIKKQLQQTPTPSPTPDSKFKVK